MIHETIGRRLPARVEFPFTYLFSIITFPNLIMFFSLLAFAVAKFLVPVPQDDLDTLNNLLIDQVIPNTNRDLKTKLKALDPLHDVASGSSSKAIDMKICRGMALSTFDIEDLNGLSNLLIDNIKIMGADVAEDEITTMFDIRANIKPINVDAHVSGKAGVSCGVLKPHVGIGGVVRARELQLVLVAKALVVTDNGFKVTKVTVEKVNADFKGLFKVLI